MLTSLTCTHAGNAIAYASLQFFGLLTNEQGQKTDDIFQSSHDIYQIIWRVPCYHRMMDIFSLIISSALGLLLVYFVLRLSYSIVVNLINGQKFHNALEQEFDKLRLSRMLGALGINKTAYIYQTNVNDIKQQMENCTACKNTDVCDEKLSGEDLNTDDIAFCNNEKELKAMDLKEK